jgi:hypothetical protein
MGTFPSRVDEGPNSAEFRARQTRLGEHFKREHAYTVREEEEKYDRKKEKKKKQNKQATTTTTNQPT